MNRCPDMPQTEAMERYLRGELEEPAASAFEEHYFTCDSCFAALEDLRSLRTELVRSRKAVSLTAAMARHLPWLGLAAAVLALGVAGTFLLSRERPAPTPEPDAVTTPSSRFAELARVEPPAWTPVRLRGSEDEAGRRFREAMEKYEKGDWAAALPILRDASQLDPSAPGASFYRGGCALLAGDPAEAAESLERVVALGDTPYLEEARFYLAKARLAKGDAPGARNELLRIAREDGRRRAEARLLLGRLDALGRVAP
ncbi:MAG: tetratricopeptide repeat protein [Thermoanaerobaculia bacterium]